MNTNAQKLAEADRIIDVAAGHLYTIEAENERLRMGPDLETLADAIDAARFAHPQNPRERPRSFEDADPSDREYATRLAKAVIAVWPHR